ncbi:DUF3244 domain-containing protein [Dyadobacter tibetensis]|uniref:DUF3244 domain-containing protein n=1 Tax=Dyadobacter tibetensis TaxID=1211851 RepID=UPI00046F0A35|nr:hypothetical protein [Dyadobacter tibetensis]
MKTSIKTTILAFALLAAGTVTSFASDKETKKVASFGTGIYKTVDGNINVLVDKKDVASSTTILIRNERYEVIYRETLPKSKMKFGRSLNVSELNPGSYQIEITSNGERKIQKFEVDQKVSKQLVTLESEQ